MPSVRKVNRIPLEWRAGKCIVVWGDSSREFDAEVFGPFAIRDEAEDEIPSRGLSVLVHTPTGLRVCSAPSGQLRLITAVLVTTGQWYWKKLKLGKLNTVTREEWSKSDCPSWVPRWVRACDKVSKYIDPEEFKLPTGRSGSPGDD